MMTLPSASTPWTWKTDLAMSRPIACLAPPNCGGLNSPHIHGTHVPVEEPSTASKADIVPMALRGFQLRRSKAKAPTDSRGAGNRRHLASVLRQGRKTRILTPVWESSGESQFRGLFGESWFGMRLSARSSDEMYGGWGVFAKLVIRTLIIAPILFTHRVFAADGTFPWLDEGRDRKSVGEGKRVG